VARIVAPSAVSNGPVTASRCAILSKDARRRSLDTLSVTASLPCLPRRLDSRGRSKAVPDIVVGPPSASGQALPRARFFGLTRSCGTSGSAFRCAASNSRRNRAVAPPRFASNSAAISAAADPSHDARGSLSLSRALASPRSTAVFHSFGTPLSADGQLLLAGEWTCSWPPQGMALLMCHAFITPSTPRCREAASRGVCASYAPPGHRRAAGTRRAPATPGCPPWRTSLPTARPSSP